MRIAENGIMVSFLGESNANSLCNLIGMTLPEMMDLFLFLGLGSTMNYRGKKVFRINGNNFREFLESEKLGSSYFDRMKVGNVPGGVFGEVNTYKGLWLGMGHNDNGIVSNPSSQFQYFSRPPRINEKKYRQLRFELGCVLDGLKEENGYYDDDDDDSDGGDDGAIASLIHQRAQSQLEEVTNLGFFLDELVKGKKTMAETERIITAALNETIRNAEMKRNSALKKLLSTTAGCNFDETNDESVSSPTELSMKLAPFLFLYKIPLQPDVLSLLLKEIMQVSKTLHQKDVLTFTMWNGRSTTICSSFEMQYIEELQKE